MATGTNRAERIRQIIKQRRPLAKRIAAVTQNLRSLEAALEQVEQQRLHLLSRSDEPTVIGQLRELELLSLQREIATEVVALGKLKSRFDRDVLQIGVIGRARQGKSRLLQSLTGLTRAEIPDGDRQHCTGVRSTIHHYEGTQTHGEVWFHTERSFLEEIIAPYYEKLHLGMRPISLREFASQPLPMLPESLAGYAEPGAMYQHLKRYRDNLDKYRHLLGTTSPLRIAQEQIREYVAQDTADGQRVFFNYLAVRDVKIACQFPHQEVGQIALVDMPGLGDTGIGDEERLLKTLGQEVDAAIFVRMPKASGDYWADVDVRLYDIARDALTELPLEQWSFLVLNRTDITARNGDNFHNCQDLADSLSEKHLKVVNCKIVNCASEAETSHLLDSILNYLAENIVTLDRNYAESRQDSLGQLSDRVRIELEKAEKILGIGSRGGWFPLFEQLFEQLWDDLANGLESLLKRLREQRDDRDWDFEQQVEAALQTCQNDPGIPSQAAIETRRNRVGGYPNAYYDCLNEVRAHLSQHFLMLDKGLKQGLDRVKTQVAEVLIDRGRLGGLAEVRGAKFLAEIADRIPESLIPNQESRLRLGFEILSTFELSYRGTIQHRIRDRLDDLTPDETSLQLSNNPTAAEVLSCLKSLHSEAVYRCRTALDDLLAEPNQAAFAIVEEFLDRVLRAEGVKTEWRIFLESVRHEIWPQEFEALGERSQLRQQWLDSVAAALGANQLELMKFL